MTREFNTNIAKICGIGAATVAHYIYLSVMDGTRTSKSYDNEGWCRCSVKMFTAELPFMTCSMVETALEKLLEMGIIRKRCLNKNRFDHTNWYTFTDYGYQFYEW